MIILQLDDDVILFYINNRHPFVIHNFYDDAAYAESCKQLNVSPQQLIEEGALEVEFENLPRKAKTIVLATITVISEILEISYVKSVK